MPLLTAGTKLLGTTVAYLLLVDSENATAVLVVSDSHGVRSLSDIVGIGLSHLG